MHRDIKPGNIVFSEDGTLKIIDFNSSKTCDSTKPHTKGATTPWYRSPAQLFSSQTYDGSTDIWSAGIVLGELFNRKVLLPG